MKIFNVENGIKKAYVQLNDIAMLMHSCSSIPVSIMQRFFYNIFIVNDENRWNFEEFTDIKEIEFFSNLDWIVDFRTYKNMNEKELLEQGYMLGDEMDDIAREYNKKIKIENSEFLEELLSKHGELKHKMYSIRDILWFKQGHIKMPFPEVADCNGFVLGGDNEEFSYVANQGLNPFQFIISRKDGAFFKANEVLPLGFLQSAQTLSINENMDHNEFFGEFECSSHLSDDKKSFVTTYKIITPEEKEKREKQAIEDEERILGFTSKKDNKKVSLSKKFIDKFKGIFNK